MRLGWGQDNPAYRQIFTSKFLPEATVEQMRWFDELQHLSASPENAVETSIVSSNIDVLDRLPRVTVPTLVLHARGDALVPFEEGRQLASLIPNHCFVPLESKNHLLLETEPAWRIFLATVRCFLAVIGGNSFGPVPPISQVSANSRVGSASPVDRALLSEVELPGNMVPSYPNGLTQREVDVLRLIADGKSNREIADELVISFNTVAHHVRNILGKTGAANRAGIATYATRNGLLSA